MTEVSLAAQRVAVASMRAYSDLTGLVPAANIFDRNQRPEVFPCIIVGEGQVVSDDIDCADTSEVYLDLHVWAKEDGLVASKNIAGEIRRALRRISTTHDGFRMNFVFGGARYLRDPGGELSHGVVSMVIRAWEPIDVGG